MQKLSRNAPCPCGSGKKYKHCCQLHFVDSSIPKAIQTALEHHQAGRLPQAEAIFQQILQVAPNHPDALHFSGVIAFQGGRNDIAVELISKAIRINPSGLMHYNLGLVLRAQGKLDAAIENYRKALTFKPDYAEAHNNLGNVLKEQGKLDEAIQHYREALLIKPNDAGAHNNLGNTLKEQKKLDEAIQHYCKALLIKPNYVEAHNNLGNALREQGKLDAAVESYRKALALKPNLAEAHNNLGYALKELGKSDAAIESFQQALLIKPDYVEARNNLGNVLLAQGKLEAAIESFHKVLAFKPDIAETHNNLGNALKDLGQLNDAVASYRRALEIKPDFAEAHSNLLFVYNFLLIQPPAQMLAEAQRYGQLVARQARPYKAWSNIPEPDRCLRVGLVSGDLRAHPVGYFLESVLTALSACAAGRLELFAYSNHSCNDAITKRINTCCRGWNEAAWFSDEALAQRIRDDGIDILLDLSGHTAHNRLPMFAWKPAPIQATWLGYFATTGVAAIDYLIADPWTLPETEEVYFTEKIWRLPETRLCFTPPDVDVAITPLPALANGYITFGCFNNLAKVNDDVVALWARVLASVPGSRIFLKATQLNEASVRQSIVERFAAYGIGAKRMILEGSEPRAKYLTAYQRVDIALDPFPYTGGTTSAEGLWMGVPVLTLAGERFLSRQGIGLLINAGLPEWIATDTNDYVALAVSHTGDLQRLATLRKELRQQVLASPIFDAPRFARHFEAALRGMWTQWCDQLQGKPY